MMKKYILIPFFSLFICLHSFGWGPEGHAIVGRIALQYAMPEVRDNVLKLLGKMSIDTAANWMDIMKSNHDYDFMRSWHYVDFPKGSQYDPGANYDLINRLQNSYDELQHKKVFCDAQVKFDLLLQLHLIGDLHMPLHTGYDDDLGGNKLMVQYDTLKTHNLHWFWDEDIISIMKITDADCTSWFDKYQGELTDSISFIDWMEDSRKLLSTVYDYEGFVLSDRYMATAKTVVEQQLLKAGLRLANVLNRSFANAAPILNYKSIVAKYKNGVQLSAVKNEVGNKITVCGRVTNIKVTAKTTQLIIRDEQDSNELLVVIFAKDYSKYSSKPSVLFKNKNVCVQGTVTVFNKAFEVLADEPTDIIIVGAKP